MKSTSVTPIEKAVTDPDEIMTVEEAAAHYKVPMSFFYAPCRRKGPDAIPCFRVGKYLRYRKSAMDRHFEQKSMGAL